MCACGSMTWDLARVASRPGCRSPGSRLTASPSVAGGMRRRLPDDAAVVIEAFGCGLPDAYVAAHGGSARPPLWIVLEYLSAESWVDEHHGLSSPHPRLPLPRYFFFPGFTPATGGLLREADLLSRRAAFDAAARRAFWRDMGFPDVAADALTVSLFAYDDAPVAELLAAMARDAAAGGACGARRLRCCRQCGRFLVRPPMTAARGGAVRLKCAHCRFCRRRDMTNCYGPATSILSVAKIPSCVRNGRRGRWSGNPIARTTARTSASCRPSSAVMALDWRRQRPRPWVSSGGAGMATRQAWGRHGRRCGQRRGICGLACGPLGRAFGHPGDMAGQLVGFAANRVK